MISTAVLRYSDAELEEFKAVIDKKLEKALRQLNTLNEQINHIAEKIEEDGDWMDDSSSHGDLEMLQTMAHRQRKHIRDLQNALLRIKYKNYGVCVVTGELIDKRRLLAVPTTTKSMVGKSMAAMPPAEEQSKPKSSIKKMEASTHKIYSRVIRKMNGAPPLPNTEFEEEEDNYEEEDASGEEAFDFDSIADDSYSED